MKALITGSQGFVGRRLAAELSVNGYDVCGIDIVKDENTASIDLLDRQALRRYIRETKPDIIFHLAAQASVPMSWIEPQKTFEINVTGTINLLETVIEEKIICRIVVVGSSDQYGVTGAAGAISESMAQSPQNPYAASKKAQEEITLVFAKAYSLNVCLTRSFNHSGPGQRLGFLIPDLCNEMVQVERGMKSCLMLGNLEAVRDFTDVRDVVRAYRLIGEKGVSGEVYNVGSGVGRRVQTVLDMIVDMASCKIPIQIDTERMRVSDTPILVCDNSKLREHTGWEPLLPFEQTLQEVLEYYRNM